MLLTGGTGALGVAVADALLEAGAALTITYRSLREHVSASRRLEPNENPIRYVQADLRDETAVAETIIEMERVDVLIHCAGAFAPGSAHEETLEGWQAMMETNLTSTFFTAKHALLRMIEQGYGRIVTVGAASALAPAPRAAAYAVSKAGVIALTKAIAADMRGNDITANCVAPAIIDTPANRTALGERHAANWTKPADIARKICFLASESARDLRGEVITEF